MSFLDSGILSIPKAKIVDYLLSTTHPVGRHKAVFFLGHGFSRSEWQLLADALLYHASANEVLKNEETPFGVRHVVEGEMETPDGRKPFVRSVWFVDHDSKTPRFVTAYPLEARSL